MNLNLYYNIIHLFPRMPQNTFGRIFFFIHFLAQRTNQETSTLTKASPYILFHQHHQPLLVLKKRLRTFSQTLFQSLEQGLTR